MTMIVGILLKALVIFGIAKVVPGIKIRGYGSALAVAVVYALLSFLLMKILIILTFPFILLSFGLFLLVLNGFLLWVTDKLLDSFEIKGFAPLAMATVLMSVGSMMVEWLVGRIF